MPIAFDRNICRNLNETISREWLVTNGLGGYASGTMAGVLTRMQHGLLVTWPRDAATPQLLLAKIDEEVTFDQRTYYLGTNEYREGTLNPSGFVHLETFRLEEGFPIFTYRLGGIDGVMLEKSIWMPHGQNTTYIQYRVVPSPFESANETLDWSGIERTNSSAYSSRAPQRSAAQRNTSGAHRSVYQSFLRGPEAAQRILSLTLLPFAAHRPYNQPQYGNNDWHFNVLPFEQATLPKGVAGCTIRAYEGADPYTLLAVGHPESATALLPTGVWYWKFLRRHDQAAGLAPTDDLYLPGVIRAKLWPGEDAALTLIVTAEEFSSLILSPGQINTSYKRCVEYQQSLLHPQRYFGEGGETTYSLHALPLPPENFSREQAPPFQERPIALSSEEFLRLLLQARDRFLIERALPKYELTSNHLLFPGEVECSPVLISNYYGMSNCTRDTLIALPGLTLTPEHFDEARRILSTLARYFKQGMLPDRLPTPESPLTGDDYGSVDTTLWYFYALDHYLRTTHDYELLHDLYYRLADSLSWYIQGTYNGIQVDTTDGLLRAAAPGKALTWMNALAHGRPVTPRHGKAVEVNALWYHALSLMHEWSEILYQMGRINHTTVSYQQQSEQCKQGFQKRFWYPDGSYLYDVIDSESGNDTALRPNQLLAISLRHSMLDEEHSHAVFDTVTTHLLTPYGLRTLAPVDAAYQGHLKENQEEQPETLHQGSAWPWLIGPYVDALFRTTGITANAAQHFGEKESIRTSSVWQRGLQLLEPFRRHMYEDMLGTIASAFDGDEPHKPGYQEASAISVGEILRVYNLLAHISSGYSERVLSV